MAHFLIVLQYKYTTGYQIKKYVRFCCKSYIYYTRMDYEIFFRANKISLRRTPYKRNIRIERAFGEEYSINNIKQRIFKEYETRVPFIEEYSRKKKRYKSKRSINKNQSNSIYKLYLYYCYLLKVFPKKMKVQYIPPDIREDIKKMDRISEEAKLLGRNNIKSTEQLFSYKNTLAEELKSLKAKREDCYIQLKRNKNTNVISVNNEIADLSKQIQNIREKELMCEEIKDRIPILKNNINEINEREKNKEKNERSSEKYDYIK